MSIKAPPPDFSAFLSEANHGRANAALTERFGEVVVGATDKASEWGTEWEGEMVVTIKVKADKYGGIDFKFKATTKLDREPLPGAKMYYNPDNGGLTTEEPRQLKIKGLDDDDGKPRKVKSADAPKVKDKEDS